MKSSSSAAGKSHANAATTANTHSNGHFDELSSSSASSSDAASSSNHTAALRSILALLDCLTNADADGRVCLSKPKPQPPPQQQPQSQPPPRQQQPPSQSKAHGPGPPQPSSSFGAHDETTPAPSIQYLLLNPSAPFLKVRPTCIMYTSPPLHKCTPYLHIRTYIRT